ncbi:MAG: glycosyltransferase, partial [Bacteroidales bacterium]|nr:glycosyltransferase [Bacteroidales bacterium]
VSYLIKAFRSIVEKYPEVRLIIAGSGSYDTYLQDAKNICTKITFTGLLEKDELYELYRIADIGVVPSLFEPFGYVAVEMMMHGLPLVATATSGLNEVVDESCGFKVPLIVLPDNVEIDTSFLAQKILYLMQHPAEAREMGENGRKKYLKEYSSEIFRRNMIHLYSSV